ncbi:synaptotagmin-like protein 2 isoform X5 [Dermochelys coriacea]|uniref:synaptotagmin-like protein 2 isoform X5 n=1 Tax=Dermochelys coriacea TaxID=27794 RepID=UPI0018E832CD|nr:synaptotagmin-like protein 2 isoform X5 [Dermochelys coriacea]XP_038252022.1 synaptotagmin-like protein 2 isoform X5 [Dermochelys coriacea]XP_038252031.1 synaptotagmin-like protein 2 isoform X5 [Dermochelys coriacea]XP_043360042.1 synaptotagmin-like protein 2 isoform X5 [Dermochelys coriacea]
MIDLSFLTEEEQEAIMKVLQRDAELKRNEEERVRHLPEKIKNDNQLKNMSGQWFYEAKSKRHRDKIHGADIIRASIRRKSTTMAEQSQNKSDKTKNSWVNNVNKEVSVPAELSGIREETEEGEVKSNQSSNALVATLNKPQESSKKVAVSPGKQRKNPFNDFIAPEQDVKSSDSESGTTGLSQMPNADTLSPSKESQSKRNILNNRSEEHRQASGEQTDESQRIADQPPVPKARKVIYRITDPILEKDDSFPKPAKRTDRVSGAGTPPRGILKRSSSSSSTDSEGLRVNQIFDHQGKTGLPSSTVLERVVETNPPAEDPSQHSLERLKQVRFSSRTGTKQPLQSPQLQCGKDIGEFDLLESDYVKNAENDTSMLDALQNEQTLPVKSPRSQSSALDVNATDRDASQEDTSAPYSSDANRSSLPVNETLRLKTSLPMEPVIPRKSSSNISPNVQEVQIVDETLSQNISKQFPNPDLESSKHTIDQQPLSAKTKSTQVPNASTADLQGSEEELDPILKALKRSADRQRPSKSLEDIPSATSNKGKVDIPKEELVLSAEDVSTVPSDPNNQFSNPEKLKRLSKSVPAFLQEESDERDTDTTSESSYRHGRIKKSPSSLTNLSGSSGMASLSSVSGSVMSIYSGDFGNVDVKGHIQFAIDYVEQLKELHIFVSQCKDLAIADVKKQHSDPYVKTYLLPEKYKLGKRKTSVKKKTLNPVYNEILRYKIDKALVKTQRLNLSVWHNDTFGRNSFLGEVELDLGTWDWNDKQNKQMNWFPLKPRTPAAALELENRGEIKLALQYVPQPVGGNKTPSTGEVHIWVKECNDLPLLRGNKLNSFVKCTILPDTSRKSRQKTRAVEKTTNPVFNHTMVYDGFRTDDLKEACVELTVWDHHKLANHFLGGLRIGMGTGKSYGTAVDWMDSTLDETTLWERMMSSPNKWVEDTLPLRMLMVAKLTK